MSDTSTHERCVSGWLDGRAGRDADNSRITKLLLVGLRAVWDRARPSLGEVTLAAIVQRAVHSAERRHPELAELGLRICERGVIEIATPSAPRLALRDAAVGALVEVLRAIATLTANALTPALHAALSSTTIEEPRALVLLRSSSNPSDARDARDARDERGTP
jgi:hypothetical protein